MPLGLLRRFTFPLLAVAYPIAIAGCSRDVSLAEKKIPTFAVRTVTHYGVLLDQNASPQQVAFAVLRSIREDVQSKDDVQREKALAIQCDLAAADQIQARNRSLVPRDEYIYRIVHQWASTVSRYVSDFETQWDMASPRFVAALHPADGKLPESADVAMVVQDPSGGPEGAAVLVVWLVKDHGYWRATHLGFERGLRSIADRTAAPSTAAAP